MFNLYNNLKSQKAFDKIEFTNDTIQFSLFCMVEGKFIDGKIVKNDEFDLYMEKHNLYDVLIIIGNKQDSIFLFLSDDDILRIHLTFNIFRLNYE